jgi:hypothetical protein
METPRMGDYPVLRKLPPGYCREIGRIVHKFAFCEMVLRTITYNLMRVGPKVGRVAVRQPRVVDHITMLEDLESLYPTKLGVNWKKLKELLKEAESYRDRLSHGIWLDHPNVATPVLQDFSYAYVPRPPGARKARIDPIAVEIKPDDLRRISSTLDDIGDILVKIEGDAAALGPLTSP